MSEQDKSKTGIDTLLISEKGIKGEIGHAIHKYANAYNKYMKDYDINKESCYGMYWDINNLYEWVMSQLLHKDGFK